jgi:hypothetical protein
MYVFTTGGAEKNSSVVNLFNKIKEFATGNLQPMGEAKPNAKSYEKSGDGKVVYAFKPKSGEGEGGAEDPAGEPHAEDTPGNDGNDDSDNEEA